MTKPRIRIISRSYLDEYYRAYYLVNKTGSLKEYAMSAQGNCLIYKN